MKKLFMLGLLFVLVGCTARAKVEETGVPTFEPSSTPKIIEYDLTSEGSKIKMDSYSTSVYFPIVDGVVTYPDGTTDEFANGVSVINMDGEEDFWLYDAYFPDELIAIDLENSNRVDGGEPSDDLYLSESQFKVLSTGFPVYVSRNLPESYVFVEDSRHINDIIDGILGLEYTNEVGEIDVFVAYRYSTHIPEGYEMNESFRVIRDEVTFYVWRMKEFTEVESYVSQNQNFPAMMWIRLNRGETLCTLCSTFK